MSDIDIHHLAAAYALDALDENERLQFEAHYSGCEICRTDVVEHRETAAALGSLTESAPRPELRTNLMAEIAQVRQLSPLPSPVARLSDRHRGRSFTTLVAAAAAVVIFAAGAFIVGGRNSEGGFGDEIAAVLAEPDAQFVRLDAVGPGNISVAWAGGRAVIVGDGLPSPASGSVYELWLIDDAGAHPMSLLDPAEDGKLRRSLAVDGEPTAWGITIEPESGSSTPTEPILFVGAA